MTTLTTTMKDDLLYIKCPNGCDEGIIERDIETEYGWRAMLITCDVCEGSGKVLREYDEDQNSI